MSPFLHDFDPLECGPRTIKATYFGGKLISTVRLTHPWPILKAPYQMVLHPYETLVFDREGHEIDAAHYLTRKQALAGHWHALEVHMQSQ